MGKGQIMIQGPKADGTYVVTFRTAAGEALAISVQRDETAVLKHFQERMPEGLLMSETPQAHQAIGEYFSAFSELERGALKVVLKLRGNVAADAIVGAIRDFQRKASILFEAAQGAEKPDGTKDNEWRAKTEETIKEIFGCNDDRNAMAHAYLEPLTDGSVALLKPGRPRTSPEKLDGKIEKLKNLTEAKRPGDRRAAR